MEVLRKLTSQGPADKTKGLNQNQRIRNWANVGEVERVDGKGPTDRGGGSKDQDQLTARADGAVPVLPRDGNFIQHGKADDRGVCRLFVTRFRIRIPSAIVLPRRVRRTGIRPYS